MKEECTPRGRLGSRDATDSNAAMEPRTPLALLSIALHLCAFEVAVGAGAAVGPNFIFILADDWGWGDNAFNTGPSGGAPPHTPHLDRLAATGVIFTDFHTASPVCSPSRAGFMTGRDPARFRIHTALNGNWEANAAQDQADYLEPSVATVTRLLQDNGWRTGHFGKWHLGSGSNATTNESAPVPTAYGINSSCTFNSNDPCLADASDFNTSVDIVDHAIDFITDAHAADERFYVNIWLHVSHNRLDPTDAQKAAAGNVCAARDLATNQSFCAQQVFVAAQQDADAQIGRLVTLLGNLDLHESTLILFSTDNGPEEQRVYSNAQGFTGPFRGRKRSLYEGGTRVPSFAVWGGGTPKPTIPAGAVDHTPMSATDWLPTVLAIAGVAVPPGLVFDGEDMTRVFLKKATGQRLPEVRSRPIFWEWRYGIAGPCDSVSPHLAVRDGDFKYLVNADGSRPELYLLDVYRANATYHPDFHERRNLASMFPDKVATLDAALRAWHATIPQCAKYQTSPSCEEFSSPVFPGAGSLGGVAQAVATPEDSDPDFWFDPESKRLVFY